MSEAENSKKLGLAGDPYTVAFNPIRDTIFMGNQQAYDTLGRISMISSSVVSLGAGGYQAFVSGGVKATVVFSGEVAVSGLVGIGSGAGAKALGAPDGVAVWIGAGVATVTGIGLNKANTHLGWSEGTGGFKNSFAEGMSPEDALKYDDWMQLRKAGLDQPKVNDILLTNKGLRPNPNTYLSNEYITNHLSQFDNGATKIMINVPDGSVGHPSGTFAMPSSVADDLISQAGGNISKLETSLGLEPGALGKAPVRVDIPNPSNVKIPSGNELGANSQWLP